MLDKSIREPGSAATSALGEGTAGGWSFPYSKDPCQSHLEMGGTPSMYSSFILQHPPSLRAVPNGPLLQGWMLPSKLRCAPWLSLPTVDNGVQTKTWSPEVPGRLCARLTSSTIPSNLQVGCHPRSLVRAPQFLGPLRSDVCL